MSYPASSVAKEFVKRAISEKNFVTQMKLQKILYFAQGIFLAEQKNSYPLLKEQFQAWKFGPVIPEIYHSYKLYGSQDITNLEWVIPAYTGRVVHQEELLIFDSKAQAAFNAAWELTKDVSATQLSNWTHQPGSPWEKNYRPGVNDINIPNAEIQEYFREFLKQPSA